MDDSIREEIDFDRVDVRVFRQGVEMDVFVDAFDANAL